MKIRIFVGTGGVGKTSVAAASALKAAASGSRCLVLTVDPSQRLKTALGLHSGELEQRVPLDPFGATGELWAALLSVRACLDRAVRLHARPAQAKAILEHPIYQVLVASLAGMQELMAIERIHQALEENFDQIFIDTAPSRHAFEFLDKPEFFVHLVSFPIVKLVGRTYHLWERSGLGRLSRKSFELYTRMEEFLGANLVRQILDFFSLFQTIAEGYAYRARRTLTLLRDPGVTGFTIVTTPLRAGHNTDYLWEELTKRNFPVESLVVNRVWPRLTIQLPADRPQAIHDLVSWYGSVCAGQEQIWEGIRADFSGKIPRLIRLPELPRDVDGLAALYQLAQELEG